MTEGIYTLANDVVYDQLVALLNSIEANAGREIPVCVIPYNDQIEKVKAEIATRKNVTLFEDQDSIAYWEDFATQAWKAHSNAEKIWQERGISGIYRITRHRKYCCFDGPFEKFIFFDGDTLLMRPLDDVYQKLDEYDWVTNDYQYKSAITYIFDAPEEELLKIFSPETIQSQIFCSGWFASKRNIFDGAMRSQLLEHLKSGEADVMAWRDSDQTLLNYMVWRSGISFYNFAYHGIETATGSHWSSKFDEIDHVLYDQGKPITYIHYMSVPSSKFTKLCEGEDTGIPYKELFLHYRYLNSPNERPVLKPPSWFEQKKRAVSKFLNQKIDNLNYKLRQLKSRE
ncbi:MAG: Npun_R2821/Npun_R2822 family protein [Limnoraphis robusta]|jgi:hypothetical protein